MSFINNSVTYVYDQIDNLYNLTEMVMKKLILKSRYNIEV